MTEVSLSKITYEHGLPVVQHQRTADKVLPGKLDHASPYLEYEGNLISAVKR